MKTCIVTIFLVLMTSACATKGDLEKLQFSMSQENKKIIDQMSSLEQSINAAKRQLKGEIDSANTPVRSTQANLWAEVEALKVQTSALQGNVDQITRRLDEIDKSKTSDMQTLSSLQKETETLSSQVSQLGSQLGIEFEKQSTKPQSNLAPPITPADRQPAVEEKTKPEPPKKANGNSAQRLYDDAHAAFKAKDYDKARRLWSEFVSAYDKHELAPNAVFWQGEAFYQMNDFAQAILAYDGVIKNYAKSSKVPAAMLKQGMAFTKLGKTKAGEILLEELIKKYPKSAEAKRAKALLR